MPFDLSVIRDGVTYSLSAGTPYMLQHGAGLFWPEVLRNSLRAPAQDGDTDYGSHLAPRLITLTTHFYATSGSALDGFRDTFFRMFRPSRFDAVVNTLGDPRFAAQSPIVLQVTRDDGGVRQIGVYATGPADIALVAEDYAGKLHRCVVQLVAPNPTWSGTVAAGSVYTTSGGSTPWNVNYVYSGDYYGQPVLDIAGSVTAPIITNVTTGATLNFSNVTLPNALTSLLVDTVTGVAYAGGSVVYPTNTLELSAWRLAHAPVATGGTNNILVTATSSGTMALMTLQAYPRYLSY